LFSPFHGGNTGSNPAGDANKIKDLLETPFFAADTNRTVGVVLAVVVVMIAGIVTAMVAVMLVMARVIMGIIIGQK
jgi:hypothetical protein